MKNVFFALAFMLVGTFTFANRAVSSVIDIEVIKLQNQLQDELFGCTFTETTTTVTNPDGETSTTTTRTVTCDTPRELAEYMVLTAEN